MWLILGLIKKIVLENRHQHLNEISVFAAEYQMSIFVDKLGDFF